MTAKEVDIGNENNYYFFSLAYSNIPAILSIIEGLDGNSPKINIVVHIESHRLFWEEFTKCNKLPWTVIFLDTNISVNFRNILSWVKVRRRIRQLFKTNFRLIRGSHIYFFSSSWGSIVFALIKLLAERNRIYFIDCDNPTAPEWRNFKNMGKRFLIHLLYGIDVKITNSIGHATPTLSERFFQKAKIEQMGELQDFYDAEILSKYNYVGSDIRAGKRIVWLDDDCWCYERPSNRQIYEILNTIEGIIESNFSRGEVLFKRHPNPRFHTEDFDSIYGKYPEYPYHVPADFIFAEPNIRFVMGGSSTALRVAAKYHDITSISYLKLISFQNEAFKERLVGILKAESDDKILFPASYEELNSLWSKSSIDNS